MDSYEQILTFKTRSSFRAHYFWRPLSAPWSLRQLLGLLVNEDLPSRSRKCGALEAVLLGQLAPAFGAAAVKASPHTLPSPDIDQETPGGKLSRRGKESWGAWREENQERHESDSGLPASSCTCGQGWAGALAGGILQKRVEWGRAQRHSRLNGFSD